MFNISPLMAFNVAMLMDTKAILPFMATYMRSSGFDIKATVTIDQKNAKPIHNKNEVIPRWFP